MLVVIVTTFVSWYHQPSYVKPNPCTIEDLVDTPEAIDNACQKMGPLYNYTIDPDGTLRVDRGDGKLLKVRY